ncbi:hypothetical protein [Flavivirga rizhaonensis]|uniref:Uncharacterized protein n=1 Tax=Flavivirga rizhaonensis TaxID=2559571 RepID=A0A4S1DXZ7_9FLAO|nr:hypothetical protein [Flavivirga rizhaonensis]TGV02969.1 hypothetical protein EM932_08245 [Flavivirga rizhaonensis]
MKNLKYLILVITLVFGCEDETLPEQFQDATWVSNIRPGNAYVVNQGQSVSFRDLSQGALSHEFIIEEGNKYLYPGFGENDSLPLFVNDKLGTVSTDKDAHVLFLNPGINEVKLRNTFKDSVTYQGAVPIPAFQENGVWVIENVWTVDVFGPLKPAFKVLDKDDNEVVNISGDEEISIEDKDTWPVIQVEAGDALTYIDLTSEDRPTGRAWVNPIGKPASSNDSINAVGYFSLGRFNAGNITSIREGDEFPGERVKKLIPLVIEVIPSSQPFIYNEAGGIKQNNDDSITIGVTGEIEPFVGAEDSFTVRVVNTAASFDEEIPVLSATINPSDATKIDLVLSQPVYNTDEITVAYAGNVIESVDTRVLQGFGPIDVQINFGANILTNPKWGFETAATTGNITRKAGLDGYWAGGANDPNEYFFRNTEKFVSGSASLRYSNPNGIDRNITLQGYSLSSPNGIPAGSYLMSYQVYLEVGNTMKGFSTSRSPFGVFSWDLETLPRGEWVEVNRVVTTGSDIPSGQQINLSVTSGDNSGVTGEQIMYWDDLSLILLEERP